MIPAPIQKSRCFNEALKARKIVFQKYFHYGALRIIILRGMKTLVNAGFKSDHLGLSLIAMTPLYVYWYPSRVLFSAYSQARSHTTLKDSHPSKGFMLG